MVSDCCQLGAAGETGEKWKKLEESGQSWEALHRHHSKPPGLLHRPPGQRFSDQLIAHVLPFEPSISLRPAKGSAF